MLINQYTRFSMVEGLGDEEIPWWIAPYVRDLAALAKSTVALENLAAKPDAALASFTRRLSETAAVARVAVHMKGNEALTAAISAAVAAEIDEFCGTPPKPHRLEQAGLAVSLLASSLEVTDPAKAVLVSQAERLQRLRGQSTAAAA
jgi:hypothetical protein